MTGGRRGRDVYCSPEERGELERRARGAGMTFSRYMLECALHGQDGTDGLALSENEQRELLEAATDLDRISGALLERLPGADMSAIGALALLARLASRREGGR